MSDRCPACGGTDTDPSACTMDCPEPRPLARVKRYVQMRARKPLVGLSDTIHGIHMNTEWEAELLLSDLEYLTARHEIRNPE